MRVYKTIIPGTLLVLVLIVLSRIYGNYRFSKKYKVLPGVYETKLGTRPIEGPDHRCPEIQRLDALVEYFERTGDFSVVLQVGDMYARGCFPRYTPDDGSALNIYLTASKSPDPDISADALAKYIDLRTNPLSREDREGTPFPKETSDRLVGSIENHLKRVPLSSFMRKRTSSCTVNRRTRGSRGSIHMRVAENAEEPRLEQFTDQTIEPIVQEEEPPVQPRYTPDPQNVHDHGVSASVRENIKAVVKELGDDNKYNRQDVIEAVMEKIRESGMEESKMNNAFRVIVSLVPDNISSIGCSQMDVLNATFKKINKIEDVKLKKNLFESLGKNLSSGVEKGHVVCSTGKIGRIITTLEGIESIKLQKSVPIDVIRNEISSLASKIRTDVLSESSDRQVSDYEKYPGSVLSEKMEKIFRDKIKETYIDGLHLSQKVLDPIIDTYASVF